LAALLALTWLALGAVGTQASTPNVLSELTANVTDRSFTVSWVTDQPVTSPGQVYYGTSSTASTLALNVGEQWPMVAGARGDVHTATINGLQPSTTYYFYFKISGTNFYDGGIPYNVKTTATATNTSPARTATGKVLQSNTSSPAPGVIVSAQIEDFAGLNGGAVATSALLSTITDAQGNWSFTLNPRTLDGSAFFLYQTSATPVNGTPDQLQVTFTGGALGNYPMDPLVLTFGNGTNFSPPQPVTLIPSTPTPTAVPGTATPTITSTATSTATGIPTTTPSPSATAPPTATSTSTSTPTATLPPLPPSPTPPPPLPAETFPTPEPILPTVAPVALALPTVPVAVPPVPTQGPLVPIQPTPAAIPPGPSVSPAPSLPMASLSVPSPGQPTPLALAFPYNPDPTPRIDVPTPVSAPSLPTVVVVTPAVNPLTSFAQVAWLVAAAVGTVGVGATFVVVGLVRQWRGP
jgi:hypothetical protein